MKSSVILFAIFALASSIASAQGTVLEDLNKRVGKHLSSYVPEYISGTVSITDVTKEDEYYVIIGKFKHKGFWTNVYKPYTAKAKKVLDDFIIEKLCYWKYWSGTDRFECKCTDGSSSIDPMPDYPPKF